MRSSTGIKRFAGLFVGRLLAALSTGALSDSAVTKGSKAANLEACVAPTSEMRRNHMDYLKHGRVETVRDGVRGLKYSLAECVDCHAEKSPDGGYKPVDGEGQFCAACHAYTAVSLACFQCHRKTPGEKISFLKSESGSGQLDTLSIEQLLGGTPEFALTTEAYAQLHAKTPEE